MFKSNELYRGYQATPSTPFPDGTILKFGGGEIRMRNDEWFNIAQVVEVFLAFLEKRAMPSFVKWRDISEILE